MMTNTTPSVKAGVGAYPFFIVHVLARCWKCGSRLRGAPVDSGYGKGNGEYVDHCAQCDHSTWYDCAAPLR